MTTQTLRYDKEITALLVIDPYNDFISEGGKIWDCLKAVAEANQCVSLNPEDFPSFCLCHLTLLELRILVKTCVA
jgi:hypothetical protein